MADSLLEMQFEFEPVHIRCRFVPYRHALAGIVFHGRPYDVTVDGLHHLKLTVAISLLDGEDDLHEICHRHGETPYTVGSEEVVKTFAQTEEIVTPPVNIPIDPTGTLENGRPTSSSGQRALRSLKSDCVF